MIDWINETDIIVKNYRTPMLVNYYLNEIDIIKEYILLPFILKPNLARRPGLNIVPFIPS